MIIRSVPTQHVRGRVGWWPPKPLLPTQRFSCGLAYDGNIHRNHWKQTIKKIRDFGLEMSEDFAWLVKDHPNVYVVIAVCTLVLSFLFIFRVIRLPAYLVGNTSDRTGNITRQQACKIYERKLIFMRSISSLPSQARAIRIKKEQDALASRYRIPTKAVEDIWNRKTWVLATAHLWSDEQATT